MNPEFSGSAPDIRQETAAAFAHEIRTPLTSLVMALELGKSSGQPGTLHFEPDLASLLRASVDGLVALADTFQEVSRLERGLARLSLGQHSLAAVLAQASAQAAPIAFDVPAAAGELHVTCDGGRMARAVAGLATGVDRAGSGSGAVDLSIDHVGDMVAVRLASGSDPGGADRPVGPDAGFGFYAAWLVVRAHEGELRAIRRDGFMEVVLSLPAAVT